MPRMLRMQARRDFTARGYAHAAGEIFDATQVDAFLLAKRGQAKLVRQSTPLTAVQMAVQLPESAQVGIHDNAPLPEASAPSADAAEIHKAPASESSDQAVTDRPRRYRRRDRVAEDVGADG